MSTTPTPGLSAFEEHIKTTAWFKVLSAAKDDDDGDGASIFRIARMAAQEAWTAALSSQPPSAQEGVRIEVETRLNRGQAKSAAPVEPAAISEGSLRDGVRIAQLEAVIRRALESLCGDYPSMAADLRSTLEATPPAAIPEAPLQLTADEHAVLREAVRDSAEVVAQGRVIPEAPAQTEPVVRWDDPRVQKVYELLVDAEIPPPEQHWEGWVARRIVDALAAARLPGDDDTKENGNG